MKEIWQKLILSIKGPRVLTIIGGGGKTSLMYYLLGLVKSKGLLGVGTTTTKLASEQRSGHVFATIDSVVAGYECIKEGATLQDVITLVRGEDSRNQGKMLGIPKVWVDELAVLCNEVLFLVEGDGAAGKSLKGHLGHEPVVPRNSHLVVVVVGIDSMGVPINALNVHRPERICELTGAKLESLVTTDLITQLLFHPQGYLHDCCPTSQIVFYINKVESIMEHHQGKRLAAEILATKHPQVIGVVLGSLKTGEGLWLQA